MSPQVPIAWMFDSTEKKEWASLYWPPRSGYHTTSLPCCLKVLIQFLNKALSSLHMHMQYSRSTRKSESKAAAMHKPPPFEVAYRFMPVPKIARQPVL